MKIGLPLISEFYDEKPKTKFGLQSHFVFSVSEATV